MKISKIFEVFEENSKKRILLFTKNLTPGLKVYNERLIKRLSIENGIHQKASLQQ